VPSACLKAASAMAHTRRVVTNPSAVTLILFDPNPDSDRAVLMERSNLLAADVEKTMPGYLCEDQAASDSGHWAVMVYFDSISAARQSRTPFTISIHGSWIQAWGR
jgi:hypothetical protein